MHPKMQYLSDRRDERDRLRELWSRDMTPRGKEEATRVEVRQANRRERRDREEVEEYLRERVGIDLEEEVRFYWRQTRWYGSCRFECECGLYRWYADLLARSVARLRAWRESGTYSSL